MEMIQWYTSTPGKHLDRVDATKHCLFRLDELDKDFLSPETLSYIKNENAKYSAEKNTKLSSTLTLRVTEDDIDDYRMACLEKFALLIGVLKPGQSLTDWILTY